MNEIKDGLAIMYVLDGVLYPVGLTQEQVDKLGVIEVVLGKIRVLKKYPQGSVTNLVQALRGVDKNEK